mmetsp:Transcript_16929/g.46840  ORF Transcript_16929/g.46840 Transcript_16929/m.46840 type:complete len:238 (-) Transcript_16929:636-1349(-)|eukprot:CAMPEP_0198130058 /NCGR_PEP_ID=MMETSP1442-20131203/53065_1 /TAXON_ID= /ORGANISM="Craspedostauros australis, Strain CCMP3328" /LENGTH=237 /DNA_ID=CAMNT_0043790581 /DNA_START=1 /DNA_END=714 /DNA_ORIENTATION=+
MKLTAAITLLTVASVSAFVPQQPRAFVRPALQMADDSAPESATKVETPAPAEPKAEAKTSALVPIKEETIEFTAGLVGGAAGFIIGGPVVGAITAAAANYVSKMDNDASGLVTSVSKSAIEVYNYLLGLDDKYKLLTTAQTSLESAVDKLKSQNSVDEKAVKKVEDALSSTKQKIDEVNDEYDLVGAGFTTLGVIGDLVEQTVNKASELNEEYKLTSKAKEALSGAVDKAKDATKKA